MNINDLDKLDDKSLDANSELVEQEALRGGSADLPLGGSERQEIHDAVVAEVTELGDHVVKEIAGDIETGEQDGLSSAGISLEGAVSRDELVPSSVENGSTETVSKDSTGTAAATSVFKKPSKLKSTSVTKEFLNRTSSPKPLTLKKSTSTATVTTTVPSHAQHAPPSIRSRLVTSRPSKPASGGSGSGSFGMSGLTSVKSSQGEVWGKNKPAAVKTYTDEELSKQLGIHLAQRLEVSTKEANNKWDEMDDELFDLDTIEFGDGTKVSLGNDAADDNIKKTEALPELPESTKPPAPVAQQVNAPPPVNPWKPIERTVVPLEIPIQGKVDDRKTEKMMPEADSSSEPKLAQKHTKEERFAEDNFDRGSWRTPSLKPSLYNYEKGQVQEYHTGGVRRRYSHTPSEGRTESVSEGKSGILARHGRRDSHGEANHDHIKSGESGDVRNVGKTKEEIAHHRASSNTSSARSNHAASAAETDLTSKQALTSPVLVEDPILEKETGNVVAEQQAEMRRAIEAAKARKRQEQEKQEKEEEERRQRAKARADALAKKQAEQAHNTAKAAPRVSNKPSRVESKRKAVQERNSTAPTSIWTKPSTAGQEDHHDVKKPPFISANGQGSNKNSEVEASPISSPKRLVWGDVGSGSRFAHIGNGSVDLSSLNESPNTPPQEPDRNKDNDGVQSKWPNYGDKERRSVRSEEGDGGEVRRPFVFGDNPSLTPEASADSPRMSLNPVSRTMAMNPLDDIISPKTMLIEDEESRRSRFFPRQEVSSLLSRSSANSSPWRNLAVSSRTPLFDDANSSAFKVSLPLDQLSPSTAHARVHLPSSPNLQIPTTPLSGRMTPPRFSESADLAMARIQALLSPQPVEMTAKLLFSEAAFGAPIRPPSILPGMEEDYFSLSVSLSEVEDVFPEIEFGSIPLIVLPKKDSRKVYGKGMVPLKKREYQWPISVESSWKLFQPIKTKGTISIPLHLPFTAPSTTSNLTMPNRKADSTTAKPSASTTPFNIARPLKRPKGKAWKSRVASVDNVVGSNVDGE